METEKTRQNTILGKIKGLKKPYQIAIIVGVFAVIVIVFLSFSSPKTPFNGLKDGPNLATVEKRYGQYKEEKNPLYNKRVSYEAYEWLGYRGKLIIDLDYTGHVVSADWDLGNDYPDEALYKICRYLDDKYEKSENEYHEWHDRAGNRYGVSERSGLTVYFVCGWRYK